MSSSFSDVMIDISSNLLEDSALQSVLDSSSAIISDRKPTKHIPPRIDQDLYQAEIYDVNFEENLSGRNLHTAFSCPIYGKHAIMF